MRPILGRDRELATVRPRRPGRGAAAPLGAARRRRRRRQDPAAAPSCATAPPTPAGGRWSGTASTSATARCPTCRSPRSSAGSPATTPARSPPGSPRRTRRSPGCMPGRRLLSARPGRRRRRRGPPVATPDLDRADLFEAVHAALEDLAAERPAAGRRRGRALGRPVHPRPAQLPVRPRRSAAPVAVVASYRSDDLHRRHPLRATVAEWVRLPGVQRLQLDPLPDADVRALVRRAACPAPLPESERARDRRARRGQRVLRRGAGRRRRGRGGAGAARRPRRPAAGPPRPARRRRPRRWCARPSCSGRRVSHDAARRGRRPATGADLDAALRAAVEQQRAGAGRRRRLRVPARPARRGGLRRPAARRAGAAARGVRRGAAQRTRRRHRRRAGPARPGGPRPGHRGARPASRPATRRCRSAGPTRPPGTTRPPSSCSADRLRGEPSTSTSSTCAVKAADALVASGHPRAGASSWSRGQLTSSPADAPAHHRARLLMALAAGRADCSTTCGDPLEPTTEALGLVPDEPDRAAGAAAGAARPGPPLPGPRRRGGPARPWRRSGWPRSSTCRRWSPT